MQFTAGRKLRASELNYDTETGVDCHYRSLAAQSFAATTINPITLGTAVRTTALVTQSVHSGGVGHDFKVLRGGLWTVTAAVRIGAGGAIGNRFLSINHLTSGTILFEVGQSVPNTGVYSASISGKIFLSLNDTIWLGFYNDGSAVTSEVGGDRVSLRMAWDHD